MFTKKELQELFAQSNMPIADALWFSGFRDCFQLISERRHGLKHPALYKFPDAPVYKQRFEKILEIYKTGYQKGNARRAAVLQQGKIEKAMQLLRDNGYVISKRVTKEVLEEI